MNYSQYINCDSVNGEGLRCSLWVSGCTLKCKGCFSPKTHDFKYGQEFTNEIEFKIIQDLKQSHISGLSVLGGHMFEILNYDRCLEFLYKVKQEVPEKNIWVWTGLTLDKISKKFQESLDLIDVLIDGPFIESLKTEKLAWRGSTNQRVLIKGKDF